MLSLPQGKAGLRCMSLARGASSQGLSEVKEDKKESEYQKEPSVPGWGWGGTWQNHGL